MSTENYLTLFKESIEDVKVRQGCIGEPWSGDDIDWYYGRENEISFIVTDDEAEKILNQVNNGHKYSFIKVKEPFKNDKKVIQRTVDLRKFKSLNKVQKADNLIRFKRLIVMTHKGMVEYFIEFLRCVNVAEKNENINNLKNKFDFSIHTGSNTGTTITTYRNCKVLEYSTEMSNKLTFENVYLTYEDIVVQEAPLKENVNQGRPLNIENVNEEILPKGKKVFTSDFVSVYIKNVPLGLVQECEIGDFLAKAC